MGSSHSASVWQQTTVSTHSHTSATAQYTEQDVCRQAWTSTSSQDKHTHAVVHFTVSQQHRQEGDLAQHDGMFIMSAGTLVITLASVPSPWVGSPKICVSLHTAPKRRDTLRDRSNQPCAYACKHPCARSAKSAGRYPSECRSLSQAKAMQQWCCHTATPVTRTRGVTRRKPQHGLAAAYRCVQEQAMCLQWDKTQSLTESSRQQRLLRRHSATALEAQGWPLND